MIVAFNGVNHYFSLRGDDKLIHLAAQKVKQQDSMNEIEVKGTSKNAMKPLTIEQLKAMATQNINSIATAFRNAKNAYSAGKYNRCWS